MSWRIVAGGLDDPRVVALIEHHVGTATRIARHSAHAMAAAALRAPDIDFWSLWDGDDLVAIGALRRLSDTHGEIKSMHVAEHRRGQGAGGAVLDAIIAVARKAGLKQLSLETGASDYFRPAHGLYHRHGFIECAAFQGYKPDPNSLFFTRMLDA